MTSSRSATFGGSIINMSTDTIDWVAAQEAIYRAEDGEDYAVLNFGNGKHYRLSRGLEMPISVGSREFQNFSIRGNGATLEPATTARMKIIYRDIPAQHHALNGIQSYLPEIYIENLRFQQEVHTTRDTTVSSQSVGIMLMGYKCNVSRCYFYGGDIGLDYQFGLQCKASECTFAYQTLYGCAVRNGQWDGAGLANAQSNGTIIEDCRFLLLDRNNFTSPGQFAGAYIVGASDCEIRGTILEGAEGSRHGESSSSVLIGTGAKTFTTSAGLSYTAGQNIIAWNSPNNTMTGTVTSYVGTTLILNIASVTGSGTLASWSFIRGNRVEYGIYNDGLGASVVKDFTIHNVHIEKEMQFYAMKIIGNPDQQTRISKICLIATRNFCKLVEHGPGYGGVSRLILENFPYQPPTGFVIFKNIGSGGIWKIYNVMTDAPIPAATSPYTGANDWLNISRADIWDLTSGGSRPITSRFYAEHIIA